MKAAPALAILLAAAPAHADAKAEAITLFDQGIQDMQAGRYDRACSELAASLAKYTDSGTKGALAECETHLGKIASAWQRWRDLADTAPTPDLRADAAANADKLASRLPHFIVKLRAGAPAEIAVAVNDSRIDPRVQVPLPIDPGPVVVVAHAPGYRDWTMRFEAKEGAATEIDIPNLEPVASRRRYGVLGLGLAGAGVVALGVGVGFGLEARSKWNAAKAACNGAPGSCPSPAFDQAAADERDAHSAATVSTILFAAGGAIAVTGAMVWLLGPRDERPTQALRIAPSIGSHTFAVSISGEL